MECIYCYPCIVYQSQLEKCFKGMKYCLPLVILFVIIVYTQD